MKRKTVLQRIVLLIVPLLLAVSLCSCSGIAVFLLKNATQNTKPTAETQTEQNQKPTGNTDPSLYHQNAEEVITRSDTAPTEHGSAGDNVFSVSEVVKKAQDSVVQIYISTGAYGSTSAGSGVIVSAKYGYILTCNHVVSGANTIVVELSDNTQYTAKLLVARIKCSSLCFALSISVSSSSSSTTREVAVVHVVGVPHKGVAHSTERFHSRQTETISLVSSITQIGVGLYSVACATFSCELQHEVIVPIVNARHTAQVALLIVSLHLINNIRR